MSKLSERTKFDGVFVTDADLDSMPVERVVDIIAAAIVATVEQVEVAARAMASLERRGFDLTELRKKVGATFTFILRQVACGHLLAPLAVRLQSRPAILQLCATMPILDQVRLVKGESFDFAERTADSKGWTTRRVDPELLTTSQFRQLIGPAGFRDVGEQILMLEGRERSTAPPRPGRVRCGGMTVERDRGGLMVGRTFLPAANVVEALGLLASGEEDDGEEDQRLDAKVTAVFTASEMESLRVKAAQLGISVPRLLRRSAMALGLLRNAP